MQLESFTFTTFIALRRDVGPARAFQFLCVVYALHRARPSRVNTFSFNFHGFFPVFGSCSSGAHDNQIQNQIVTYTHRLGGAFKLHSESYFCPVVAYENDRDPEIKQQINKLFAIELFIIFIGIAMRAPTRPARAR